MTARVGKEHVVHVETGTVELACNLGCVHRRVRMLRRHDLAVVEERTVPDLFSAAYGQHGRTRTGARAVDQFGTEWFRDWEGAHGDGYGGAHLWTTADGSKGWQAAPNGRPWGVSDGFIIEGEQTP